jgi:hypothetical protein
MGRATTIALRLFVAQMKCGQEREKESKLGFIELPIERRLTKRAAEAALPLLSVAG